MLVARYNGVNESGAFKKPPKLPAIVYFRKDATNPEDSMPIKSQIVYESTRDHMVASSTEHQFIQAMELFISKNRGRS